MKRRRVLLLGASSQVGIFVAPGLRAQGLEVIAVSRRGRPSWYPRMEGVRWLNAEQFGDAPAPQVEWLVSTGPIRLAVDAVHHIPTIRRAVVFSTSSMSGKADSRDPGERGLLQHIAAMETSLRQACTAQGAALSLLRPTLIYGCGMDRNVSWLARWIRRFGFVPVAGAATGLRQPVHAADLAAAAVAAIAHPEDLRLDTALCGGSTLEFRAMVERVFAALDRPARIVSLPPSVFMLLLRIARVLPGLRGMTPEMVRRQGVDLVFDDTVARATLGYEPRPFNPLAEDFERPGPAHIERLGAPLAGPPMLK